MAASARKRAKPKKKWTGRRVAWTLLVAVGVVILAYVLCNQLLRVRVLKVEGNVNVDTATVQALSGIQYNQKMMDVHSEQVAKGLSANPFVELKSVERCFPDTVVLHIWERQAAAKVGHLTGYLLIDKECNVLETVEISNLRPEILGMQVLTVTMGEPLVVSDPLQIEALADVMQALDTYQFGSWFTTIDVANPVAIQLGTSYGITVNIGTCEDMEEKLAWTQTALPQLVKEGKNSGRLDVSSGKSASYIPPTST